MRNLSTNENMNFRKFCSFLKKIISVVFSQKRSSIVSSGKFKFASQISSKISTKLNSNFILQTIARRKWSQTFKSATARVAKFQNFSNFFFFFFFLNPKINFFQSPGNGTSNQSTDSHFGWSFRAWGRQFEFYSNEPARARVRSTRKKRKWASPSHRRGACRPLTIFPGDTRGKWPLKFEH